MKTGGQVAAGIRIQEPEGLGGRAWSLPMHLSTLIAPQPHQTTRARTSRGAFGIRTAQRRGPEHLVARVQVLPGQLELPLQVTCSVRVCVRECVCVRMYECVCV